MPYQPFQGLQAPPGLQMQWQPNIGGEDQSGGGQSAGAGLGSASEMLKNWLATRRKGIAVDQNKITDLPTQAPQNMA